MATRILHKTQSFEGNKENYLRNIPVKMCKNPVNRRSFLKEEFTDALTLRRTDGQTNGLTNAQWTQRHELKMLLPTKAILSFTMNNFENNGAKKL